MGHLLASHQRIVHALDALTTPHVHGMCVTFLHSHDHSPSHFATSYRMCVSTEPALALPQLSALMGVPYSDLGPWLDSVSASSPQLPQQWPVGQEDHSHSQLQAQQLISLAAFAAADAGKVTCNKNIPLKAACACLLFSCSDWQLISSSCKCGCCHAMSLMSAMCTMQDEAMPMCLLYGSAG